LKPVIPRTRAWEDLQEALAYYKLQASGSVALSFLEAVEKAFVHVGRRPSTGSPRVGSELGLPGLHSWPVAKFPYLLFYLEREAHIDVWRILHAHRDIPEAMRD
jgi:toxin ParE1/3/4